MLSVAAVPKEFTMKTAARCALSFLAVVGSSHAGVIVVDPAGGPAGAALLQAAIDAAQDGDILLLRPGDYSSAAGSHPQLIDRSLTLIVDGPAGSVVLSGLTISSLIDDSALLVRGLHVAPLPLVGLPSGAVEASTEGKIWFEDCVFTGAITANGSSTAGITAFPGFGGFGNSLAFVRCTLTGADGADEVPAVSPARPGAPGADLSTLCPTFHECTLQGGTGGDGDPFVGGNSVLANGGAGLSFNYFSYGSLLGSTLKGGDEGANNPAETQPGPGMSLFWCVETVRDTQITAGVVNGAGTPSPDIVFGGATAAIPYPAAARGLSVPSPLREGESFVLHAYGEVGDGVFVYFGFAPGLVALEYAQGDFLLAEVVPGPLFLGMISDPSGVLDTPFQMPGLPVGVDGVVVYLQAGIAPAGGGHALIGSGSALVWIDGTL